MKLDLTPRKKPPTKDVLAAKQRAREERIKASMQFPWRRMLMGLFFAILAVVLVGGGVYSLILATSIIAITMRGQIKHFGPPGR